MVSLVTKNKSHLNILGVFRRGESGYSLQVPALLSSGCGLCAAIPNAKQKQPISVLNQINSA